jgi:lipoyl(octanoyl) transferase
LNVDPDMSFWDGIVPCGLTEYSMVSLADLIEPAPKMDAVIQAVIEGFGKAFDMAMIKASP